MDHGMIKFNLNLIKMTLINTPFILSILFTILTVFSSCNEQKNTNATPLKLEKKSIGKTVYELDSKATLIYQDKNNNYWFSSKEKGVYKYNGKNLILYTSKDGLISYSILGNQEDKRGNLFFDTPDGVNKFDRQQFTILKIIEGENEWKLEPNDLWFRIGWNNNGPYRYDGKNLFHLKFPKSQLEDEFHSKYPNISYNPYGIYSIYKDHKGTLWFGTSSLGIYRFDGEKISWMYEKLLTETPEGGSFGIRSIIEDKEGYFWICNSTYKYKILPDKTVDNETNLINYKREKGIENNRKKNLYFMSMTIDNHNDLWMISYNDGIWKNNGKELIQYPIKNEEKEILLFAIYNDNQGNLWIATHNDGTYKYNGETFEKFKLTIPK